MANPAGERYALAYTAEGLMTAFTDPKGNINRFDYDDLGRLVKDTNAGEGGWSVTATEHANGYTNAMTTGEGRTTGFSVDYLATGDRNQTNAYPDGTVLTRLFKTSRYEEITTAPDGTLTRLLEGPDPRFGMQSPVPASRTVTLPSGLSASTILTRTASLADPNDPLSLTALTDTVTVNGKAYQRQFDAASQGFTAISPVGRTVTTTVNPQGRPVKRVVPGLAEVVSPMTPAAGSSAPPKAQGLMPARRASVTSGAARAKGISKASPMRSGANSVMPMTPPDG